MQKNMQGRRRAAAVLAAAACAAGALATMPALAQQAAWPAREITIVVPFPPGGSNDVLARTIGKKLSDALGQPVVVDNRPGVGGSLGAGVVARASADGYMLLATSSSYATNAAVQTRMPFDPVKSLVGIAPLARGPFFVAVRNDLPAKTPAELVALAKSKPGQLNYASGGPGSINQFATELLKLKAGVNITHVPYKGMAPAAIDLMSGNVDILVSTGPSLSQAIKSGKARMLAITSLQPSSLAPELQPMASAAPGYRFEQWWGLMAPAGIPDAVAERINAEVRKAVESADLKPFFQRESIEPYAAPYKAFADYVRQEVAEAKKVAAEAGIQAD